MFKVTYKNRWKNCAVFFVKCKGDADVSVIFVDANSVICGQNQQRELTVRHAKETEKEMQKRLDVQKAEYEEAIKRHISFIDQVITSERYKQSYYYQTGQFFWSYHNPGRMLGKRTR